MATVKLKVARIGNSRGVRLPAAVLKRYQIGDSVLMEERSDGVLLRPDGPAVEKLSWEDTAREMAKGDEDWSAWDVTSADGVEDLPWRAEAASQVAAPPTRYRAKTRSTRKR